MQLPCCVYAGDADPEFSNAKETSDCIPRASFVALQGLSHMQAFYANNVVVPEIEKFLAPWLGAKSRGQVIRKARGSLNLDRGSGMEDENFDRPDQGAKTWLRNWRSITLSPGMYAETFNLSAMDAFKIFGINIAIGVSFSLLISCAYWSVLFKIGHWDEYVSSIVFVSVAPLILAFSSAVLIVLPSVLAYGVFRWTKGRGVFVGHLARTVVCSNVEWINAIFYAVILFLHDADSDIKYPYFFNFGQDTTDVAVKASLVSIGIVRIYYSLLQCRLLYVYHFRREDKVHVVAPGVLVVLSLTATVAFEFIYLIWLVAAITNLDWEIMESEKQRRVTPARSATSSAGSGRSAERAIASQSDFGAAVPGGGPLLPLSSSPLILAARTVVTIPQVWQW
jgi:hypothetical protein